MRFGKIAFKAVELKGLYAPASRVFDPQKYPPTAPASRASCASPLTTRTLKS